MKPMQLSVLKCLVIRRLRKKLKRCKRSIYVREIFKNRVCEGERRLVLELENDPEYHRKYFRMNKENFDDILECIKSDITHANTHARPITPLERLALTIRYLASGNSQISIGISYRIAPSTVSSILRETMLAICSKLEKTYLPKPQQKEWILSEKGFSQLWNFPNCCGAIDGKHIRIKCPALSGSMNFNYKSYFSIVLMAVVDPYYKFLSVDIGQSGSMSDGGVLSRSTIGTMLEDNTLLPNEPKMVGSALLPYVIVGDDAFPLRRNLMKPYPGKNLTPQRRIFNYRLSTARMIVECAFGILANRWRILHTTIAGDPEFIRLIVKTTVVLHNYLIVKRDNVMKPGQKKKTDEPEKRLESIKSQGSNNYTHHASDVRQLFTDYFNGAGAVLWQNSKINE